MNTLMSMHLPSCLFSAPECSAVGLLYFCCMRALNINRICITFLVLIIFTGFCSTADMNRIASAAAIIGITFSCPFHKTSTCGLIHRFRVISLHLYITSGTKFLFVVYTFHSCTSQFCHFHIPPNNADKDKPLLSYSEKNLPHFQYASHESFYSYSDIFFVTLKLESCFAGFSAAVRFCLESLYMIGKSEDFPII